MGAVLFLATGCYSPDIKTPDKEEDPFKGTTTGEGPVNEAPPPKNAQEPDMDYIKDMLRRSADQGAQCNVEANAGPRGTLSLDVTIKPNGRTGEITVYPPHSGTPIGECVKRAFEGIFVPGWAGENSVKVERKVDFAKKEQDPTP